MRPLLAAWRLLRVLVHGVHGLLLVLVVFPRLPVARRQAHIAWWSAKLLRVLGMQLQVQGRFNPGPSLVVANHISWLDIMAVHAVCPQARFVSKADVQQWPVVNRLVDSAGTLYIQREKRRDALRVVHQMAEALQGGDTVAVFPEGTTGDGGALLPFHANLLQAAITTATPIQPVALRYADAENAVSPAALWLGETTLAQSLWQLACGRGLVVLLQVLPPVATAQVDRRVLAEQLHGLIGRALRVESSA